MSVLAPGQLVTLRKRPHKTQLWMAIYKPDVLLGARVNNASAARGDITIPYDGVYTGSYTDVQVGMTLYYFVYDGPLINGEPFFSREGAVGRLRVRSITSSQVVVAENSIPWQDNEWIQIVRFVEPWPVFPRMVLDGSNIPTWYKDYDITYTDQNDILDPVVIMGPNRAGTLKGPYPDPSHCTGDASFYFDGSDSYDPNPGGTITDYLWTFYQYSGIVTYNTALANASAPDPGWVGFGQAGNFAVSLTVTNDQGKSSTSWRFVVVNNPIEATCTNADAYKPIRYWSTTNLSGNYQSGGWEGKIWFREPVGLESIVDGALVIIYAVDSWGEDDAYLEVDLIGGNYPNAGDIVFTGYVRDGSVELSPDGSSVVTVGLTGLAGKLDSMEGFGVSTESVSDPGSDTSIIPAWAQLKNITVDIAAYHYLRWHTTIYSICDVHRNGDTQQLKYADFDKGSLYQAIDKFMLSTVLAHVCFDAQGTMWVEKKIDIVPVADRAFLFPIIMSLLPNDWREKISIVQRVEKETSYAEVGGFFYSDPSTDISTPFIASAPSQVPEYEGRQVSINGLVLTDQDTTNQLVGDILANLNKLYPSVTVPMSGNYRVFDIAPQQRLLLTIAQGDTNLEVSWHDKSFIPRQITYNFNNTQRTLLVDVVCEEETDGEPGVSGPYPPIDPCANGGCEPPPCPCADPDCNCEPPPCTDCGVPPGDGNTIYLAYTAGIARTRNFLDDTPNWTLVTGAITGNIRDFILEPYNPGHEAWCISADGLWNTTDLNSVTPTWTLILSTAAMVALVGGTASSGPYCVRRTIADPDFVVIAFMAVVGPGRQVVVAHSHNHGVSWPTAVRVAPGGVNDDVAPLLRVSNLTINKIYATERFSGTVYELNRSLDGGHTFATAVSSLSKGFGTIELPYNPLDPAAADAMVYISGQTTDSFTEPVIRRSFDNGNTFSDINAVYLGDNYAGGANYTTFESADVLHQDSLIDHLRLFMIGNDGFHLEEGAGSHRFFETNDGGTTWIRTGDMPVLNNGYYFSLGGWPFNAHWHYCLFNGINGYPDNIYFTQDDVTWVSKLGDWSTAIDPSPSFFNTGGVDSARLGWHMIVPVWVALT